MTQPAPEDTTRGDAKVRGALARYRVMAIITGTFLLTVFVGLIRYVPGIDEPSAVDAFFTGVAIVHGWIYVIYLLTTADLWMRMRWGLGRLLYMAAGGVVPLLSFFAERRIAREVAGTLGS